MKTLLRNGALGLLLLAVVGIGAYYLYEEKKPCVEVITYRIGSIDPRFGINEEAFKASLLEASSIWNTAAGKVVLAYDAESTLPVSLMYDERQAAVKLGDAISDEQKTYDAQRASVDSLISEHESMAARYERNVASFNTATKAYEASVESWNAKGGAPPAEYQKLESERKRLASVQSSLNKEADRLNSMAEEVNQEVAKLNALAQTVNAKVNTYNEVAGEEFDQGQYVRDEDGTRITIYEFSTKEHLARALAHEFGHALGIEHTTDPQSLMYPYNSGGKLELHPEDVDALRTVCELP